MSTEPVSRLVFIQNLVATGLTYEQANRAYNSIMSTIADGIVNGQKVYLNQIGVLNPVVMPPRQVKMCFPGQEREFYLDKRLKYNFRLFKRFSETHELKWIG